MSYSEKLFKAVDSGNKIEVDLLLSNKEIYECVLNNRAILHALLDSAIENDHREIIWLLSKEIIMREKYDERNKTKSIRFVHDERICNHFLLSRL